MVIKRKFLAHGQEPRQRTRQPPSSRSRGYTRTPSPSLPAEQERRRTEPQEDAAKQRVLTAGLPQRLCPAHALAQPLPGHAHPPHGRGVGARPGSGATATPKIPQCLGRTERAPLPVSPHVTPIT